MADPAASLSTESPFYDPTFWPAPPRPRYWLHALLLLLTFFTTLTVGSRFEYNFLHHQPVVSDDYPFPLMWVLRHPANLLLGIPFSLSLMGILLAHEMGHYLYCRRYRVYATLPYFLPAPTFIGTLGAFIRIKSPIQSRRALFDIGIGGPIAGFVVALPLLLVGLALSHPGSTESEFGFPIIFHIFHRVIGPAGPLDRLQVHPIAIAAWFGMFATSLNLLPGGQLDGGHIIASIVPRAHRWISVLTVAALFALSIFFFAGWLLWAIFLALTVRHPWVPASPPLNRFRQWTAVSGLVMLIVTLAPRPFVGLSILEIIAQFRHGG